jgi:hypothetical protein
MHDTSSTVDHVGFPALLEAALRGVVRGALAKVATTGLIGEHHFYISFATDAPGVAIPKAQRALHQTEMTIVLQHQFSDLVVGDEAFEVSLAFGGVPARLRIPFAAITRFADPSVGFGLQFEVAHEPSEAEAPSPRAEEPPAGPATVVALDTFRKK